MGIFEEVSVRLRAALRARDAARVSALRNLRAALLTETKREGVETLADADCVAVLRRLEKQRLESIQAFEHGGRAERAAAERAELEVLREFVPRLADEETTRAWLRAAIAQTGAESARDLGRVMSAVMQAHRGEVDGALARRLAAQLLAS